MVTRLVSYQFWFKNIVMKYSRKHLREFPLNGPEERIAVPIAGDGAIATGGIGYGRLIPLLILDTTNRPDLNEAIRIQSSVPSGDVEVSWGNILTNPIYVLKNHKHITLFICFKRPTNRNAIIEFDVVKRGILVESILTANAVYIQAGKPGDRISHDFNRPKMLIEVPDTGFRSHWDAMFSKGLIKYFRSKGLGRNEAKSAVKEYLKQLRDINQFRMKN